MAGDWLKVEKDTPDKPEVLALAARLGVTRAVAFLACFDFWCWADSQTTDGNARSVSPGAVDDVVGLPGFASALAEVGWLHIRNNAVQVPNFGQHMGQSSKRRALTAKRVRDHTRRQANAELTQPALGFASLEKSKRKKKDPPQPPANGPPDFDRFWAAYPRKEAKKDARKVWDKLRPDPALVARILDAVERRKRSDDWLREGGRFIPHPSTWLNGRRWEDETAAHAGDSWDAPARDPTDDELRDLLGGAPDGDF